MHSDDSTPDELQPELIAALRSLGGARAPAELAARVELVRAERLTAPPELWQRVSADLHFGRQRTRVISWPRLLSAAAGVLLLGGITWLAWPASPNGPTPIHGGLALAGEVSQARQRALRARLIVTQVAPERLSPTTRAFSEYFGGPAAPSREEG